MPDFHERPLVYVAGPYSSNPKANVVATIHVANELQDSGLVTCLIPHLNMLWHETTPMPDEHWYEHDLALLARCDAVYRIEGYSPGADVEELFAGDRGIPVFRRANALYGWASDCLDVFGLR